LPLLAAIPGNFRQLFGFCGKLLPEHCRNLAEDGRGWPISGKLCRNKSNFNIYL
jgi:hypothetical protein